MTSATEQANEGMLLMDKRIAEALVDAHSAACELYERHGDVKTEHDRDLGELCDNLRIALVNLLCERR